MDERDGRKVAMLLVALFVGINVCLLWYPDIIQDISEGFSSCEHPVRILFNGRNSSELPLPAVEALTQWSKYPDSQPKLIANQRIHKGFVSILIPVFELESAGKLEKLNSTLQSLVRHSWNKDQLEMTLVVVVHTPDTGEQSQTVDTSIQALIRDYIYHINVGFISIIQLPMDRKIFDRRKEQVGRNETVLEFHDHMEVFHLHYQRLLPHLDRWNSHVMVLCPGYVAEERVLSSMKHFINTVSSAGDAGDSWIVMDFAREDPTCPLVGRLLRTSSYRRLYEFMAIFDRVESISESLEVYLKVKSQLTLYLMKPVLFKNPSRPIVELVEDS